MPHREKKYRKNQAALVAAWHYLSAAQNPQHFAVVLHGLDQILLDRHGIFLHMKSFAEKMT